MKLYRFMSKKEFAMLTSGCDLVHVGKFHAYTDSVGFCFLPEKVDFSVWDDDEEKYFDFSYTPAECIAFLGGIVTNDVLVELETSPENVRESCGCYADPTYVSGYDGVITVTEYCTRSYNRDIMVPCRYALVERTGKATWYSC